MSAVSGIPEKFWWCRDVKHSWDQYDAKIGRNEKARRHEMHQVLLCTRCGTFKTRVMKLSGVLVRNHYTYPDGYLLGRKGGLTPADRAYIRRMNIKRAAGPKEEEEEDEE